MCLTKFGSRKKSRYEKVCYKIFEENLTTHEICSRFHKGFKWEVGKEYEAERAHNGRLWYYGEVNSGYFHSYEKLEYAIDEVNNYYKNSNNAAYLVIYECAIPSDTPYYWGIHSDGHDGYASKRLILKKLIA